MTCTFTIKNNFFFLNVGTPKERGSGVVQLKTMLEEKTVIVELDKSQPKKLNCWEEKNTFCKTPHRRPDWADEVMSLSTYVEVSLLESMVYIVNSFAKVSTL